MSGRYWSLLYNQAMIRILAIVLLFCIGVANADTQQEIDHLLSFVASTDCEYDRNGAIHSGPEARDHINMKYQHYKKKVETTEDFIKYSATKSKISGRKYQIRCPDQEAVDSNEWLLKELQSYRAGK